MADFKNQKPGFVKFVSALKQLQSPRVLDANNLFVTYGKSAWLVQESVRALRSTAKKSGHAIAVLEAKELNDGKLTDVFLQSSLFEPATLYIISKADQAKSLIARLADANVAELTNKLMLVMSSDRIPAALAKISTSPNALEIPCFPPWPNEMPKAIDAFASIEGIDLDSGAIQVLLESVGHDLQILKNEIVRLSLHFGETKKKLSRDDVAPLLGVLKEDDIYQLDRYLLDKKWSLANSLLLDLINRGEKPLSVLAMLTNHCRNVLNICDGISKGFTQVEIGNRTRLPAFIMKNYLISARNVRVPAYEQALSACHHADRKLKSVPIDGALLLSQVIAAMADTRSQI